MAEIEARIFGEPTPRDVGEVGAHLAQYLEDARELEQVREPELDLGGGDARTPAEAGFTADGLAAMLRPELNPAELAAAQTFKSSPHSINDVVGLTMAAPHAAREYLSQLRDTLQGAGQVYAAAAIDRILRTPGDLGQLLAMDPEANLIFPMPGESWEGLRARRAYAPGWEVQGYSPPSHLTGALTKDAQNNLWLNTRDGRWHPLVESALKTGQDGTWLLLPRWAQTYLGDGPVTVQGTLGADGSTFNVEGVALNADGKFNRLTYGRANVAGDDVTLASPRGPVLVTDPRLKSVLRQVVLLGATLPGEPTPIGGPYPLTPMSQTWVTENGRAVFKSTPDPYAAPSAPAYLKYDGMPDEMFVLVRFRSPNTFPPEPGYAGRWSIADMAHQAFYNKPVVVPAGQEGRVFYPNDTGIGGFALWLRGRFVLDANGQIERFDASYVGQSEDQPVNPGGAVPDADPIQSAVLLSGVQR
jgi:hypothetical protein